MHTTLNQLSELLATVYAGLFIGLVYDVLRVFRRIFRAGKWLTAFFDILFWLLAALVAALALFYINGGEVRFFSVAGFVLGALLFIFGVSPLLGALIELVTRPFRAMWGYICKKCRFFYEEEGERPDGVE